MENLINDLKSQSHAVRDSACIRLIDFITEAKSVLIGQTHNPENKNNRGTMLYALSFLNCDGQFAELLKALLDSGFEVANGAYNILCQQFFEISNEDTEHIEAILDEYFAIQDESDFASDRVEMIRCIIDMHLANDDFAGKFQKYTDKCAAILE